MASTSRPIALADQQLEIVKSAARHISPEGRGEFLQSIADALSGGQCGDVSRAVRLALAGAPATASCDVIQPLLPLLACRERWRAAYPGLGSFRDK